MGDSASVEILGKSMIDWVKLALGDAPVSVADYRNDVEIPLLVRPFVKEGYDYIVVLFSDTPLITRKTVLSAVDEAYNSGRTVVKMTRGYILSCSYALGSDKLYTNDTFYFDEEDFITAFNYRQVGLITDVLKNRILEFHMNKGVHFKDIASTLIGCDVAIEEGVTVGYGNIISGRTRIKKGALLGDNTFLCDCIIDEGAVVDGARLSKTFVGKEAKVGAYCVCTNDTIVGERAVLDARVTMKNTIVGANSTVNAGTVMTDAEIGKSVIVGANCVILPKVKIGEGSFIAAGSTISESVEPNSTAIARARQSQQSNKSDD
jgi:bifunctional N-acetylglucosamine-1-phosphate-uridyltransferase/glucosamine-1-phosphate-acetyltransferase GlmU-like protein